MRRTTTILCTLLALLLQWSVLNAQVSAVSARVPAIWRTQHIDFRFRSDRIGYRCEEFAGRLARILNAMGARLEARTELRCGDSFSSTVTGSIVVTAPIEATAVNVQRALADITTADELAARLNGLPDPKTRIHVFPAEWQRVSSTKARLDAADCELLRAVAAQVFVALPLRESAVSATCMSNKVPRFNVMALVRVEGAVDSDATQSPAVLEANAPCDQSDFSCESQDAQVDPVVMPAG